MKDKTEVDYTPRASDHNERCKLCEHFSNYRTLYGACDEVRGNISPQGWCKLFSREG